MKTNPVDQPARAACRLLLALGIAVLSTLHAQAATTYVSSTSGLNSAISSAQPGDTILLNDGSYSGSINDINKDGTDSALITIKAVNRHKAEITGSGGLTLRNASYLVVDGLKFSGAGAGVELSGCQYVRITNCHFALTQVGGGDRNWLVIRGANTWENRIDHNLFINKQSPGVLLHIMATEGAGYISYKDRIDHNTFKDFARIPGVTNGCETIRIGGGDGSSVLEAFTKIEDNYFENCDADPEYVSLKSSRNTVRNNTFLDCFGSLSSRAGNFNTISGNRIFGTGKAGCSGIRIFGTNHEIFNNYVYGLPGNAMQLSAGGEDDHPPVVDAMIAFNTFINNGTGISVAPPSNYDILPEGCTVANNLIVTNTGTCITEHRTPINMTYEGNIAYATGSGSIGITKTQGEIWVTNPQLQGSSYNILKLAGSSPAIGAAVGTYGDVWADMDGESRGSTKDVGADEYSSAPQPLYSLAAHGASVHSLGSNNTGIVTAVAFLRPLSSDLDSVLAYTDTSVSTIDGSEDYAMSVRLEEPYFEVRNGAAYAKTNTVYWEQGQDYRIRTVADFSAATYSVYVQPVQPNGASAGPEVQIANNYAFRSDAPTTNDLGKLCLVGNVDRDFLVSSHMRSLLWESFDNLTTGNAPSGWTIASPGGTITVENAPDAYDKSVKLLDTSNSLDMEMTKTFTTTTTGVVVNFDIKASQTNQSAAFNLRDSNDTSAITFVLDTDGWMKTYVGATKTNVMEFDANEWYRVQIIARLDTDKFDIFVNEQQKTFNQNFRNPVADVALVRFNSTAASTGTWYINDVWVTK